MIDARNKWPLGLAKSHFPRFLLIVIAVFIAMIIMDAPVAKLVIELPEAVRAPFRIITRAGNSDWILIPTLAVAILGFVTGRFLLRAKHKTTALSIAAVSFFVFAGVALPGIVANLIKRLVGRARPVNFDEFGIAHFEPALNGWSFQSFPSGDTTTIFALAAVVMFFAPRAAWWVLTGAALVGLSRIMVGVHFPSDVFGGILLGTFGAYAVRNYCAGRGWLFEQKADEKYYLKPIKGFNGSD